MFGLLKNEKLRPQQIQDAAIIMNSEEFYVDQPIYYFYCRNEDDSSQKIKLKNDAIDDIDDIKKIIIEDDTYIFKTSELKKFIKTREYKKSFKATQLKDIDQRDVQFRNVLKKTSKFIQNMKLV